MDRLDLMWQITEAERGTMFQIEKKKKKRKKKKFTLVPVFLRSHKYYLFIPRE